MPAEIFKKVKKPPEKLDEPNKRLKFDTKERVSKIVIQKRFSAKPVIHIPDDDSNSSSEVDIDDEDPFFENKLDKNETSNNEPSSSSTDLPEATQDKKSVSDAIIQTDIEIGPKTHTVACQTEESLLNRPLTMSDYEHHRNNTNCRFPESFSRPMYAIPRRKGGEPPLKIGLTLPKGRKRRVIYPHLEEESENRNSP